MPQKKPDKDTEVTVLWQSDAVRVVLHRYKYRSNGSRPEVFVESCEGYTATGDPRWVEASRIDLPPEFFADALKWRDKCASASASSAASPSPPAS